MPGVEVGNVAEAANSLWKSGGYLFYNCGRADIAGVKNLLRHVL